MALQVSVTIQFRVLSGLPRILLGEDQLLIAEALKLILFEDFEVTGIASNGRELVSEAVRLNPDAVVLDISMPTLNGFEAAREIRQLFPAAKLVFLTQTSDRAYVEAAFALGASAYIVKQAAATELVNALHAVLAGKTYLSPQLASSFRGSSMLALSKLSSAGRNQ